MDSYLPLFPLDVVLFPEMLLPLHIFEERYKEMIGTCLQGRSEFGVVYAHDESVEEVGCTAEISKVIKRYPDGRMDILVMGKRRFQVLFFDSEKTYLRGSVELLADLDSESEPSKEKVARALNLYEQVYRLLNRAEPEELGLSRSDADLSFRIASVLYLSNELKQKILVTRAEDERLDVLSDHLEEIIPQLTEAQKAAKRAGSNGNLGHR
jgi:Lon protease-like protein